MRFLLDRLKPAALIVLIIVVAMYPAGIWIRDAAFSYDFSTLPPAKVYQMVMAESPPAGVTDIRCSGRHYFTKRWVWMRFHATPHCMNELSDLGSQDLISQGELELAGRVSSDQKYDEIDQRKVGWQDICDIHHPEFYDFFTGSTSTWLWQSEMIIDRQRQEVFVRASGS